MILILLTAGLYGNLATVLEEPGRVTSIAVDNDQLYVVEQTTVHIYKLKDYKYLKKFGKKGEGPQEFRAMAVVTPLKDRLLIFSTGKISYFSKDGIFQKEHKVPGGYAGGSFFKPIGDRFLGSSYPREEDGMYGAVNLYDSQLNKIKELFRVKASDKGGTKTNLFKFRIQFESYGNKAFVDTRNGFSIQVIDLEGKVLARIEQKDYKQRKFTDDDLKAIQDLMKKMFGEAQYKAVKNRFTWPDYYPVILTFRIDRVAKRLALITWKKVDGKNECYIYNMDGKLEKKVLLDLKLVNGIEAYPFAISDGKFYQVFDNDEKEQWELHVTKIY